MPCGSLRWGPGVAGGPGLPIRQGGSMGWGEQQALGLTHVPRRRCGSCWKTPHRP